MQCVQCPGHSFQKSCSFRDNWTKISPFFPCVSHDSIIVDPITITLYIGIQGTNFFKAIFVSYLMPARLVDGHSSEICHSLTRRYTATPFFSHINIQISPLYMMPILNSFRLLANAQCHCNPCVLFCYAVHLFIFVLKHCLTTTYYCARMVMFIQFKICPGIAVTVTGLQSG